MYVWGDICRAADHGQQNTTDEARRRMRAVDNVMYNMDMHVYNMFKMHSAHFIAHAAARTD